MMGHEGRAGVIDTDGFAVGAVNDLFTRDMQGADVRNWLEMDVYAGNYSSEGGKIQEEIAAIRHKINFPSLLA